VYRIDTELVLTCHIFSEVFLCIILEVKLLL